MDYNKRSSIHIIGIPEKEKKEDKLKKCSNTMTINFLNLAKNINL